MVCGESGAVFAVIKPASTTFPHCLICWKFCSPVQELDCLFWSIYLSSETFVPLKTALFRDRDKPRERCLASRSFSLLWLFALTKSFASFVSRVWAERKKNVTSTPQRRTLSLCVRSLWDLELISWPSEYIRSKEWIFIFYCRRSRSWSCLLFESASQKCTHCCRNNSERLPQMNETAC